MKILVIALMALVMIGGVMAAEETAPATATVTVNAFLSVTLSNTPVEFSGMDPLETANATVGNGFPLTATIGSESNVDADVKTKANTATFTGAGTFAVSNMTWTADITQPITWAVYSSVTQGNVCASVSAGGTCNIYHQLTIPGAQTAGSYSVDITITATSV